jgi:hypothetical protein
MNVYKLFILIIYFLIYKQRMRASANVIKFKYVKP